MVLDIDLPRIVADYPNIEIQAVLAAGVIRSFKSFMGTLLRARKGLNKEKGFRLKR